MTRQGAAHQFNPHESGTHCIHGAEDAIALVQPVVAAMSASSNTGRARSQAVSQSRSEAALLFSTCLSDAGMSRERAAGLLSKSRQWVDAKCNPDSSQATPTLADMIELVDAGACDVVEAVIRQVQDRIDRRRGIAPPLPQMMRRLVNYVCGVSGELSMAASTVEDEASAEVRVVILEKCAVIHSQTSRLEACVRGMGV